MNPIIKHLTNELPALLAVSNIKEDGIVRGILLAFEQDVSLCVLITENDELVCADKWLSLELEPAEDIIWADARGKPMSWFWTLKNQSGYEDGVQLEFGAADEDRAIVQLMALGGHVVTRRVPFTGIHAG